MFARQKRAEEVRPWAIIRINAPENPQGVWIKMPPTTNPMWLTEEYAIRDFKSVCRRQIEPVMMIPQRAKTING